MTEILETGNAIGRPIRRKDDAKLLHGRTNWTDNIQLPGALHMALVRSPMAHARITKVDLSGALAMPGVVGAYDAASLGDMNANVLCVWPVTDDTVMPAFPALTGWQYAGQALRVGASLTFYNTRYVMVGTVVSVPPLPADPAAR